MDQVMLIFSYCSIIIVVINILWKMVFVIFSTMYIVF